MRMALLSTDFVPMIGGVSDYLHNLCTELSRSLPLTVFTSVPANPAFDETLPYRVQRLPETRRLGQRIGDGFPPLRKLNTMLWYLQRPSEGRKIIAGMQQKSKPNLVLIGRWEERSHFWCRACHSARIPYLLFAYGMDLLESKSFLWQKRRREDFLQASRVVSISAATTDVLRNLGLDGERITLLPPGTSPEKFQKMPKAALDGILAHHGLSDRRFILTLCRLISRKGVDLAIRALAEISHDFPEMVLAIAGDGPEAPVLRELTANLNLVARVRFLGQVDEATKHALFQNCEFFVLPNRPVPGDMEGFGIVFLEASMYGKAVIGGNNGGVPDAVIDGVTGLLTNTSQSHKPLSAAMRLLLEKPKLTHRLGNAGKERASGEFSWNHLASRFLEHTRFAELHNGTLRT
jgi:phosphatidyl-myo-inositol dimannoside synthase